MKKEKPTPSDNSKNLRVCSYNIHKGFNASRSQFLLQEIRQAMRLVNADIVFLQEVVGENTNHANSVPNWISESQFEFLADSVWPHHSYGKNAIYDHGHHGNAILSRHYLSGGSNHNLSHIPFSHRGVLHVTILDHIHLFCVHFGLFFREQKAQLRKLATLVQKLVADDEAVMIAGDFNDWKNRAGPFFHHTLGLKEVSFERHGKARATFPAIFPLLPMDRIYYRGLELVSSEVLTGSPWNRLSDHCALYAEFADPVAAVDSNHRD